MFFHGLLSMHMALAASTPPPAKVAAPAVAPVPATAAISSLLPSELPKNILRGSALKVDDKTKLILLDFWASWCEPCRASLPYYDTLQKKYAAKGVTFVGVSADETENEAQEFLKTVRFSFPAIWDRDRTLVKKLKLDAIPVLIAITSDGRIIGQERGFTATKEKNLPKKIDKWLAEAKKK